jgi:hypothetical protein
VTTPQPNPLYRRELILRARHGRARVHYVTCGAGLNDRMSSWTSTASIPFRGTKALPLDEELEAQHTATRLPNEVKSTNSGCVHGVVELSDEE